MKLPQRVMELLNDNKSNKVLTTVSKEGVPHSIAIGMSMAPDDSTICSAKVFEGKTEKNLQDNKTASVLVTKGFESYQVIMKMKEFKETGNIYEKATEELLKLNLKCIGVWMYEPIEVFSQGAGKSPKTI